MRIATLSLTILCLALSVPVFAGTLIYDDGPINGTSNAFFIDGVGGPFSQSISDGFTPLVNFNGSVTVTFGEWVASGTVPTGVSYGLGTINFGGTITPATDFSSTLLCTNGSPYNGGICAGGFGYDVYESSFTIASASFSTAAESWLTLTGATDSGGTGFNGWDFFNGPATCDFEVGGIVPGGGSDCGAGAGQAFTITGNGGGTTPEPSSILLFGSGILGLAGVLRRKLTR